MSSYSFLFKYIVIGDSGVGKSCLVLQFIDKKPRIEHNVTVGIEFGSCIVNIDYQNIKLQVWDTAGQENFRSITRSYYRSAAAALLIYDITRRETFEHLGEWLDEVRENGNHNMEILLIGNKIDKEQERQVSTAEGEEFAKSNQLIFLETSALQNTNVEKAFLQITETIYQKIKQGIIKVDPDENFGIKFGLDYIEQSNKLEEKQMNDIKKAKGLQTSKQQTKTKKCC